MKVQSAGVAILFAAILLVGCDHHDEAASPAHDAEHAAPAAAPSAAASSDPHHGLTLNGEAKWQMDEHTREVFGTMVGRLEGVDLAAATEDDLKASGAVLREDLEALIAGCTMAGDAHNALHQYLTLYMPAVDGLAKTGGAGEAEKVRELLDLYPQFFE